MRELRLALIGCTGRGGLADYAHDPENGVRIVAGADKYPDAIDRFKARYREKFDFEPACYFDYREMIEKERPDGVFITSPDFLHEEQAVFCLEHKVAVYLEKPIAISIAGADRILEAAYRNRTPLMLGHNMRYMSHIMKMKELVDAGADTSRITPTSRRRACASSRARTSTPTRSTGSRPVTARVSASNRSAIWITAR